MRLRRYDEVNPSGEQRKAFDCGHDSLNRWLTTQARQSMDSRAAVTHLLLDDDVIAGYYCLSAGSVSRQDAPAEIARRAADPVPVIRMGRFAIDRAYQGQGWGPDLLREAIRSATASLEVIGARAMLVDAIDDAARNFYLRSGFVPPQIASMQLLLRLEVARLSQAASEASRRTGG